MADVHQIADATGSYLASVSLFRMPDGSIRAVLDQMPVPVIEAKATIADRCSMLAGIMRGAAVSFQEQALTWADEA